MIIKRLLLENYRRFRNLEMEFPENLIGIIGRNGTGKTTIIEAIGWSLYGNRIARTDKTDIRSQFCEANDRCRVEIDFNCSGNEYRIIRSLRGKNATSEAAIYRNGSEKPAAEQDRGVNEFIENLIGLDYRSFFASVFARQKDLAALSIMQPEERRRSINRLIGIDVIDRAREKLRKDRNEKDAYVRGLHAGLKDLEQLQLQQTESETQINSHNKKLDEAAIKLDLHKLELAEAKAQYEKVRQVRDNFIGLQNQIDRTNDRLKQTLQRQNEETTDLKKITQAADELKSIQPQISNYDQLVQEKNHLDQAGVRYASLQAKLKEKSRLNDHIEKENRRLQELQTRFLKLGDTEKELQQLGTQLEKMEAKEAELQEQLRKAHGATHATIEKGKELKDKKNRIKELGPDSNCPVCTRPLGSHFDTVIRHFDQELEQLRDQYKTCDDQEKRLGQELADFSRQLKQARSQREKVSADNRTAIEVKKNVTTASQAIDQLKLQHDLLGQEIKDLGEIEYSADHHALINKKYAEVTELVHQAAQLRERASRRSSVEKTIQQLVKLQQEYKQEIETLALKCEQLNYDETLFTGASEMVEKRSQKYDAARDQAAKLKEELAGLERELKLVIKEIDEQKAKRVEIDTLKLEIVYLDALENYFSDFRLALAGRIRPLIAARASELLDITTDSRYSRLELDEDYNIYVYDGTQPFPINRFSGGEQDLGNLCLRIAISQVVAERGSKTAVNFIVLDEIFGSQDEERKSLILTALGKLQSQFRQIFIITHVETIKDILPIVIQVDSVDESESVAKLV